MPENKTQSRRPLHRWPKGVSGNPGGRPRGRVEVTAAARERTAEALATLVHLMRRGRTDEVRVRAAEAILDRGWGRPAQAIAGVLAVGVGSNVDVEELRAKLLARLVALADSQPDSQAPQLPPASAPNPTPDDDPGKGGSA